MDYRLTHQDIYICVIHIDMHACACPRSHAHVHAHAPTQQAEQAEQAELRALRALTASFVFLLQLRICLFYMISKIFLGSVLGSSDGSPRECPDFFEKSRKIKIPSFSGFF